ncbi:MAG: CHAT domain-containing protein, partial [Saprospiraceae bacterium]
IMKAPSPFLLVALFCACFPDGAFAQTPFALDAASARHLLSEALVLFDSGQYQLAEEQAERAYHFFRQTPPGSQPGDLAEAAYQRGRALSAQGKDSTAQAFLEEATAALAAIRPSGSVQEASVLMALGNTFFQLGKYDDAMEAAQKALSMQQQLLPENHPDRAAALRFIGNLQVQKGFYRQAIPYFEASLKIGRVCYGASSSKVAGTLSELGEAYLYTGNYQLAISTLESALAVQQRILPAAHSDIARSCQALGSCQKALKKYDHALLYYLQALDIRLKVAGETSRSVAFCYSDIGQVYLSKQAFEKALEYFQKSSAIMIKLGEDHQANYGYVCNDLGRAHFALGNYPEAIRWQQKALALFRSGFKSDNGEIAAVLLYIGRAQSATGDYPAALQSFEEDQRILKRLFGPDYAFLYHADAGKADAYRKWYLKTGQDSLLHRSRHHYRMAEKGIGQQLQTETSADAQKKLLAEALPIFEKAISAELLFLKSNPDDAAALEKAWQLSEAMHSYLLFSATQEANARQFAGIPDAELQRDSALRAQITALGKKRQSLLQNQGLSLTDSLVLAANAQIFEKKEAQAQLRAFFEKNYPDYFCLKYERQTSSLAKTQQLLAPQQTLLEYFVGDSSIFVFVVQRQGSRVVELKRDFPLTEWVQSMREGISGYHATVQKPPGLYEKTVRQYADAAQKLHEKLLAPLAAWLTPELIIVPSESLAGLPFEALLSAAPKDLSNFKTYPFLLRRHTVHYAYSATMLHQMMARQHQRPGDGLLAFAPFFDGDTATVAVRQRDTEQHEFLALPFSGEEVFRAKKHCGAPSEVLTGKAATKQKFQELAGRFRILHLATHGKANHLAGDFSFLAFSANDENPENGLLSVGELYNLSLNADLVVLSACETGIGEQQRGEGVLSLARAFAYAGAKSVVASLWSVSDQSTMLVMDNFYKETNLGKPKNTALANAKRAHLEERPEMAHPFFWAGFVAVGDMGW